MVNIQVQARGRNVGAYQISGRWFSTKSSGQFRLPYTVLPIPWIPSATCNVQSCQDISHHGTRGTKHDGITILKNQNVRL